jgi:hypothetical protein
MAGLGSLAQSAAQGAVRAAGGGDAFVTAAVHQCGDQVVEHDPVGDAATVAAPRVMRTKSGRWSDPIRAANSTQTGPMSDAGSRGTGTPGDLETSAIP